MKHFLLIFILFFKLFLTPVSGFAEGQIDITSYLQESIDQASKPATPWQNLAFGEVRMVADRTGTQGRDTLILGLEIELNKNWALKQPLIEMINPELTLLFYPNLHIKKEIQGAWDTDFTGDITFPFFIKGAFKHDLNIQIQAQLEACHPELGCQIQLVPFHLMLPAGEDAASLWQAALYDSLRQVAFPAKEAHIDFQTNQINENSIRLRLIFPESVSDVEIQGQGIIGLTNPTTRDQIFEATLHLSHPIEKGDILPIYIRSTIGCFTLDFMVQDTPLLPLPKKLPIGVAFWSGLLLFLLSPAWCYWLNPLALTISGKPFEREVRILQGLFLFGLLLLGIAWELGILSEWYSCPLIKGLTLCLLIFLFLFPYPKWYIIPLLLIILPKPFWKYICDITLSAKIYLILWWAVCLCFPFNIWILAKEYILKFFKEVRSDLSYQACIRLPYILLFGWIILSFFLK